MNDGGVTDIISRYHRIPPHQRGRFMTWHHPNITRQSCTGDITARAAA